MTTLKPEGAPLCNAPNPQGNYLCNKPPHADGEHVHYFRNAEGERDFFYWHAQSVATAEKARVPQVGDEVWVRGKVGPKMGDAFVNVSFTAEDGSHWEIGMARSNVRSAPGEPSDSAAVRQGVIQGREQVLLMLSNDLAKEIREELESHDQG
jgi:hypothetical protein